MKRYVALLRGINVGGNKKVDMKALKDAFEELGFVEVSTYINSGNVLFSTEDTVDDLVIEQHLEKVFGFPIKTLTREGRLLEQIVAKVPADWRNDAAQKTDVLFLWSGYDTKKSLQLIEKKKGVDELIYMTGSIVWHISKKDYSKSGMNKFIGTELYKNMTARNINTVRKLVSLL